MSFTRLNLREVADAAEKFGFGQVQEARFANRDLETEQTGCSLHRVKPGKRQGFAHRHDSAEEVYLVLSGTGRAKLDDEIVELEPLDVIRVAPEVVRAFEAGDEGLELFAFGPRRDDDRGEMIEDWWTE